MGLIILGSGGAMPTPRSFCRCITCVKARTDSSYKRNSSSAYIEEIKLLIDCPEDIGDSLNRENILDIDGVFITHAHPDHTFGLRVVLEAYYDFIERKPIKTLPIYIGKKVFETLKSRYPAILYYIDVLKVASLNFIEHGDVLDFRNTSLDVVGYSGKESDWYGFVMKQAGKKLLYTPCDTLNFDKYRDYSDMDVIVHESGIFSSNKVKTELSFEDMICRFDVIKPKKVFLVHLEEIEVNRWGLDYLKKLEEQNSKFSLKFSHDGDRIVLK